MRSRRAGSLVIGLLTALFGAAALSGCEAVPDPLPDPDGDDSPAPALGEFVATANSIAAAPGGTRTDREGVAPAGDVTMVTWKDARGADRTMTLGAYLYEYDFSFDDGQQVIQRSANDDAWGHEGFGYVVSHNTVNGNSPLGKRNAPTRVATSVFSGGHHAVHRIEMLYDRDKEGGGMGIRIPVVIEWFVATGRDHPVWAVTWKMGEAQNPNNVNFDVYRMDTRGPYGSLNFDGAASRNQGDAIGGVAWGDVGFKFTTTTEPLTMNANWHYTSQNYVNFCRAWTQTVNAEMGIVQTLWFDKQMGNPDRVVGNERGSNSAQAMAACAGDARDYVMPCVSGWPYQLMNYDWDPGSPKPLTEASGTKLIAWGSPYGYLGASSFALFDQNPGTADGRGDRSYATFIVLGPKNRYDAGNAAYTADGDVARMVKAVEALCAATVRSATPGAVVNQVPRGAGAAQMKAVSEGYNDARAVYTLRATENKVSFEFTATAAAPVDKPIFVVQSYTSAALPRVLIDGAAVSVNDGTVDSGAFVSLDSATDELYVTVNRKISAATQIEIGE